MLRRHRKITALCFIIVTAWMVQPTYAQDDENEQPATGGVTIDADGYLKNRAIVDPTGALTMQRLKEARAKVDPQLQTPSELRKISLTRLERKLQQLQAEGKPATEAMQYLAGLTRLTHVFYYPETQDIVVAGPAEGFFRTSEDRVVGMSTGRAVLQLQDLIVALRAFGPDNQTRVISCSIDPTEDGLQRLQVARGSVRAVNRNQGMEVGRLFYEAIGFQTVTINGVSPRTHFAQVLVEADYNMKLIGIGVQKAPVKITSFIDAATPRTGSNLQRWYFQPNYESVLVSQDRMAMQLSGSGVELVGEGETVSAGGQRKRTGKLNRASRAFTSTFTKAYDKLAEVSPLYGELRNLMDLSLAAAFIQKMGLYEQANWSMETLGDESKMPVETYAAPTKVDPVVNVVWKNGALMTPIGGGVTIQPRITFNSDRIAIDEEGKVDEVRQGIAFDSLSDDQWWWD